MHESNLKKIIIILLVFLGILLGIIGALLFQNIRIWSNQRLLQPTHYAHNLLRLRQFPSTSTTPETITSWMPFSYINKVFDLPPEYLKNALEITDPRYPVLTIRKYAQDNHLDNTQLLKTTKQAIKNYLPTSSTPISTTSIQ